MKKALITIFLFALSITMVEFPVNGVQTDNSLICAIEVVSETVEKESTFSIDEDIIYPHSGFKDVFVGINFIYEQAINTIFYISYEILQPPR